MLYGRLEWPNMAELIVPVILDARVDRYETVEPNIVPTKRL